MLAIPIGHHCCYACHSKTPLLLCLPFQLDTTVAMLAIPRHHCCYACHSNWTPLLLCLPFQLDTTVAMLAIPRHHSSLRASVRTFCPRLATTSASSPQGRPRTPSSVASGASYTERSEWCERFEQHTYFTGIMLSYLKTTIKIITVET